LYEKRRSCGHHTPQAQSEGGNTNILSLFDLRSLKPRLPQMGNRAIRKRPPRVKGLDRIARTHLVKKNFNIAGGESGGD